MIPIPDRSDFAYYAQNYFKQTGMAVEVGVFEGAFAAHNLKHWAGEYAMVDTWAHRDDGTTDKNDLDANYWSGVMEKAKADTAFAGKRRVLQKGYSEDVADQYPNYAFDWVYIDAGHDYQNCKKDLEAWYPKVRHGGLFSGDDYGMSVEDARLYPMTVKRQSSAFAALYNWGTAIALHEFCEARKLQLHITWLNDKANAAWYIIKP
jgi:hypothetical protein